MLPCGTLDKTGRVSDKVWKIRTQCLRPVRWLSNHFHKLPRSGFMGGKMGGFVYAKYVIGFWKISLNVTR